MSQWRAASGGTGAACNQAAGGGWLPPPTLDTRHRGSVEVSQGVLMLVGECSHVEVGQGLGSVEVSQGVLRLVVECGG